MKDVARIGDGAHASIQRLDEGVLYLSSKNFGLERLNLSQVDYISQEDYEKHFRSDSKAITKPLENDVLLGIIGSLGAPYLVKKNDLFGLSSSVAIVRPNQSLIDPNYLYYWFKSPTFQLAINQIKSGVAQSFLSLGMIGNLPCYFPKDLEHQKSIAAILTSYEDLIENNLKRIKLLEEMAQITYEEWFVRMKFPGHETAVFDEETGLPEGWEKGSCLDFIEVMSGGTPKTNIEEFWDGSIKFFTPKDANSGFFTGETEKTITPLGLSKCNSKLYDRNTVFITARGTVGKLNLAREPMAMNQSCYALKGRNYDCPYFVFGAMSSAIGAVKGAANGGVFDAIVVDTFKYLPFIKPKSELVEVYEATVKPMFKSISNLMDQIEFLKEARDILLPRLMTGMIDIEQVELPEAMLSRLEEQTK
ncbi:hypothetical protein ADU60_03610 [Vibrio coralliilyticus]|nr:hypothetical protein ADU60_03610 [Vibrio coralliilyticus]